MNGVTAQAAIQALETHLAERLPAELKSAPENFTVRVFDCAASSNIANVLAIYPYRLTLDESLRNAPRSVDPSGAIARPLPFSIHFLMVSIADDPITQIALMAWAIDELARNPIIVHAQTTEASAVHIEVLEDTLALETLMEIWQAMRQPYRLSSAYLLRLNSSRN